MNKTALYKYFWLGTCVRYLQDAQTYYGIYGRDYVIGNIDSFLSELDEIGLVITARTSAVDELRAFRATFPEVEVGKDTKLSREQATKLEVAMREARLTLEAEIKGLSAFIVTPKRMDVNKLLEDIPGLFPPHTYEQMPEIAQYDFSEAGRCIAFERPTAGAFHMLRGTEAVLRNFYSNLIRQKRVTPLLWGPIVVDLRRRRRTKEHETLYNNLDNIRVSYRNPTQHPEAKYDIHEVQDLWGLCTEVVNRMTKILSIEQT